MSLILDALNRSEQDRRDNHSVPDLQTDHLLSYPEDPGVERWRYSALVLGSIALLALLALVIFLYEDRRPVEASRAVSTVANTSEAEVTGPVVLPELSAEEPESKSASGMQQVGIDRQPQATENNPVQLAAEISALYQSLDQPQADFPALEAGSTAVTGPQSDSAEAKALTVTDSGIPHLGELPGGVKDRIPSLRYTMHIYTDSDADRFVVINDNDLREGDRVAAGLELRYIRPEYIVLAYEGTIFRLDSLSSWINM